MGVIKRGILGGFSGKVANVVGGSWKGIAYMRSVPLSVANPKTAAQVGQRTKFSAAVEVAKELLVGAIKPLWDRFAQGQSGYNAWVSANIDAFATSGALSPLLMNISEGSLTPAAVDTFTGGNGNDQVTFNWTDNSGTGSALGTDDAYAVVYNEDQDEWGVASGVNSRQATSTVVTMPSPCQTGDTLFGYLAFRKADGTAVSNTETATVTI